MAIDDILDCPLRELSLITRSPGLGRYRFAVGTKITLPSEVLAFSVLDYLSRIDLPGTTITVDRLALAPGSPSRAFKLSESEMLAGLESTVERTPGLDLVTATGGVQLAWSNDPEALGRRVLNSYYGVPESGGLQRAKTDQLALATVGDP